jgi:hypothetical protein
MREVEDKKRREKGTIGGNKEERKVATEKREERGIR